MRKLQWMWAVLALSFCVLGFSYAEIAPTPKPWTVPANLWGVGQGRIRTLEQGNVLTQYNEHFMIYTKTEHTLPIYRVYFFVEGKLCVVTRIVIHYATDAPETIEQTFQTVKAALLAAYGDPTSTSEVGARWERDAVTVIHVVVTDDQGQVTQYVQHMTTDDALLAARQAFLETQAQLTEPEPDSAPAPAPDGSHDE